MAPTKRSLSPIDPVRVKRPKLEETSAGFSPEVVLDYLLEILKSDKRYKDLLNDPKLDVKSIVLASLSDGLLTSFTQGLPTDERLRELGGDFSAVTGVYLHVIEEYKYVGQACNLHDRVTRHKSAMTRQKRPCLHYHVWGQLPEADDYWVLLAVLTDPARDKALILNIIEMYGALLFQTLPPAALDKYLDPSIERGEEILGLNVHLPICQGHPIEEDGPRMHYLRDSHDPTLRGYYKIMLQNGQDAKRRTMLATAHKGLLEGVEKVIAARALKKGGFEYGWCGAREVQVHFKPEVLQELEVSLGDTVKIRCEIETETPHPSRYAVDAQPGDPSLRLGILCTSQAGKSVFMRSKGDNSAQRANALVDELEGVELEESKSRPRRYFRKQKPTNKFLRDNV